MILNNMIHFISKANKVKITISGQLIQYHFKGAFEGVAFCCFAFQKVTLTIAAFENQNCESIITASKLLFDLKKKY